MAAADLEISGTFGVFGVKGDAAAKAVADIEETGAVGDNLAFIALVVRNALVPLLRRENANENVRIF